MNRLQKDVYDSLVENGWVRDGLVLGDLDTEPTQFAVKHWGEDVYPYTRVGVRHDGAVKVVNHHSESETELISDW